MKVSTLLAQAAKCTTEADASSLLESLEQAFGTSRYFKHLPEANRESYLESDGPFVRFELNRLLSDHYVTMIRPEIRSGKLVVVVQTNNMLDGHGLSSRNWKVVDDMDEVVESDDTSTVADMAKRAKQQAIMHHEQLIERVGVSHEAAVRAAAASW